MISGKCAALCPSRQLTSLKSPSTFFSPPRLQQQSSSGNTTSARENELGPARRHSSSSACCRPRHALGSGCAGRLARIMRSVHFQHHRCSVEPTVADATGPDHLLLPFPFSPCILNHRLRVWRRFAPQPSARPLPRLRHAHKSHVSETPARRCEAIPRRRIASRVDRCEADRRRSETSRLALRNVRAHSARVREADLRPRNDPRRRTHGCRTTHN